MTRVFEALRPITTVTGRRERCSGLRVTNPIIGLDNTVFSRCYRAQAPCQCHHQLLVLECGRKGYCIRPSAFSISSTERAMEVKTLLIIRLMEKEIEETEGL